MCEIHKLFRISSWNASRVLLLTILVAGCGLQGPLYLPKDKQPTESVLVPVTKTNDSASEVPQPGDEDDAEKTHKPMPANTAP